MELFGFLLQLVPILLWVMFWLWVVDWRKVWPVLAEGGWAPGVLLGLIAAIVWSRLDPGSCSCLGFLLVPNFWWQLGAIASLAALALFAGWLQGYFGYTPPEISLEPPADHGHDEMHGHGHH